MLLILSLCILPVFAQESGTRNVNQLMCTSPDVISAGDEFIQCYNTIVENSVKHENKSCATSFPSSIFKYIAIANRTCYLDLVNRERDALEYYKLMQFSLRNDLYKDFVSTDGKDCINAIRDKIDECVTISTGHVNGAHDKYYSLWKRTALYIEKEECIKAEKIKRCVLNAMRNEGWYKCEYQSDSIFYVGRIFDFMLERCSRLRPGWDGTDNSGSQLHPLGLLIIGSILKLYFF